MRLRLLVLGAVLAGGGVVGTTAAGAEGFAGTYSASASADGVRLTFIAPNASLSDTAADVAGPSAQAQLDSLGASRAYGSFPYPGEVAVAAVGLVRTVSGGVPVPDYPFYASSDYPLVEKKEVGSGIYALRAESAPRRAAGSASAGLAVEGAGTLALVRSVATSDATGDAVVSEATSTIEGLSVGPLSLARIVSTARVSAGGDGHLTRKSSTDVVGASVAGTNVAITPDGLKAGAGVVPVPPADLVTQALTQAGITVEFLHARELPDGVVAPTIRITQQQESGTKLIYSLGAVQAQASGEAIGGGFYQGPGDAGTSGGSTPSQTATEPTPGAESASPTPTEDSAFGADSQFAGPEPTQPSVQSLGSFVIPDAGSTGASPGGLSVSPAPESGAPAYESAAPAGAGTAPSAPGLSQRRAAALAAVIGAGVDSKPVYAAFAIGGLLGLALVVAMRGLTRGVNR